jgi:molybdopterin-biosynthesis enzyme MoeA-like protein
VRKEAFREAITGAGELRQRTLRLFGIPESEIAATLRRAQTAGVELDRLEVTTCLRRGLEAGDHLDATPTPCSPTTGDRWTSWCSTRCAARPR